jgi:hypothetical protein
MTLEEVQQRMASLPPQVRESPARLFEAVLRLYETDRIDGTSVAEDGDMLLFQWGSYDWGNGRLFELDLTRQAVPSGEEDPPILQLGCTYRYDPEPFEGVEAGNRWCSSPAEVDAFRSFVLGSDALRRAADQTHVSFSNEIEDAE